MANVPCGPIRFFETLLRRIGEFLSIAALRYVSLRLSEQRLGQELSL
jgi:hypothetical protein